MTSNYYHIQGMTDWANAQADLIIADPPFGLQYDGKASNYNRKAELVVDGYVEWDEDRYTEKVIELAQAIENNLSATGSALIFSGWNNGYLIHDVLATQHKHALNLEGKMYWSYNFAPYCTKRPAHNVYEVFWVTRDRKQWTYHNTCSTSHCTEGEANLSSLTFKRDYKQGMPKYPTRLPLLVQFHSTAFYYL